MFVTIRLAVSEVVSRLGNTARITTAYLCFTRKLRISKNIAFRTYAN